MLCTAASGGNCPSPAIAVQSAVPAKKDSNIGGCLWPHPSPAQQHRTRVFSVCHVSVYFCNVKKQDAIKSLNIWSGLLRISLMSKEHK